VDQIAADDVATVAEDAVQDIVVLGNDSDADGDPITVAAGVMRMRFWLFLLLVSLSKTLRYAAVLGVLNMLGLS